MEGLNFKSAQVATVDPVMKIAKLTTTNDTKIYLEIDKFQEELAGKDLQAGDRLRIEFETNKETGEKMVTKLTAIN